MEVRPKIRGKAIAAAVILTVGVLGLFLRLQEYGPESALRKFHQAITRGSLADLQKVTSDKDNERDFQTLVRETAEIMAAGGNRTPRILRTDRSPNQVRAAVAYTLPDGRLLYRVWVIDRRGRSWKVSVGGTQRVRQDAWGYLQ